MLNLEFAQGRSGFQLTVEIFQMVTMEVVDFCGGFFGCKMQKKNPLIKSARKSASRKQKIRRRTTPPKSTNQSACQTSKNTPGFSIGKSYFWRRLQSMDSGTLFGCLLFMVGAPMLKGTCNPSAAAGGARFAAHPSP